MSRARRVAIRLEVEVLVAESAALLYSAVAAVVSIVLVALSQRHRAIPLGSRTK